MSDRTTHRIIFEVDTGLRESLREVAKENERTVSAEIRMALRKYVKEHQAAA